MKRRTLGSILAAALALAPGAVMAQQPATPPRAQPARPGRAPTSPPVPDLQVVRYTLPNGLEVILHEDHRTPTVAVNIWYHVGGKDEPPGRNGFAHLFEHLMFQGSRHVPEDTFFLNLERAGASNVNGTTGDDRTNYYETVPAGRLNLALWLESDRMAFLLDHVDQATFESQRNVVLNERRQNYENRAYGYIPIFLREAVFPQEHPYHRVPIGTPEDLNAATLQDVWDFFRTWYVPNNATLVIAGDIQVEPTRALVEQYFGPIGRGPDVPRRPAPAPVTLSRETRLEVEVGAQLPMVLVSWPTPAFFAPGDAALDLVGGVLAKGESSRLHRRLVRELRIAEEVSASQDSMQLGSTFEIAVTVSPGHTPDEVLRVIDEELGRLQGAPPTADEVSRARIRFETHHIFAVERIAARADQFNLYNQHVGEPDYLARDVARYGALTPADVQTAARTLLPLDRRVVALVYPTEGAPLAGRLRNAPGGTTPAPAPQGGRQ